jgi:ATP-dependent helicase YprA (DUF1998 family)
MNSLAEHLPSSGDPDAVFDAFTDWVAATGLELYPAQSEALIEVAAGSNVILTTPTGSGKTLVATGAHFAALGGEPSTPPRSRRWSRRSSSHCASCTGRSGSGCSPGTRP